MGPGRWGRAQDHGCQHSCRPVARSAPAGATHSSVSALGPPGAKQVERIREAVQQSVAEGVPWQVLLSQTVMSQLKAPLLREALPLQPKLLRKLSGGALNLAMDEGKAGKEGAELARMYVGMGAYGVPMNPDAWDGFQAERERVLDAMNIPGANPIVLAGDSHNAWAHRLIDGEGRRLGVEFDGPAVTCIGAFEDIYSRFYAKVCLRARALGLCVGEERDRTPDRRSRDGNQPRTSARQAVWKVRHGKTDPGRCRHAHRQARTSGTEMHVQPTTIRRRAGLQSCFLSTCSLHGLKTRSKRQTQTPSSTATSG